MMTQSNSRGAVWLEKLAPNAPRMTACALQYRSPTVS
jgi:hypothetical protein